MRNRIIMTAVALVAVFLLGFVPQRIKANRLETEVRQFRQEIAGDQLRDLIGLVYFQANQKNYGLAAETSSRFFSRAREMASQMQGATSRKTLEDLLALRAKVIPPDPRWHGRSLRAEVGYLRGQPAQLDGVFEWHGIAVR